MTAVIYEETDPPLRSDESLTWPPRGMARLAAIARAGRDRFRRAPGN